MSSDNIRILNDNEILFSLMSSDEAFRICDREGRILVVNQAYCKLFNIEKSKALNSFIFEIEKLFKTDNYFNHINDLVNKINIKTVFKFDDKLNRTIWLELSETISPDNSLITGFVRNVSEKIQTMISLKDGEAKFRVILNTIPFPIFAIDKDMKITGYNDHFLQFISKPGENVIGRNVKNFISKYTYGIISNKGSDNKIVKLYETFLHEDSGEVRSVAFNLGLIQNEELEFLGYVVLIEDVTERKKAEKALINSEKGFRALIENSHDAIILFGDDGAIKYLSPSTEKITSRKNEFSIGRKISEFVHPDDLPGVRLILKELKQNPGMTKNFVIRNLNIDESYIYLDCIATNLLNDEFVKSIVLNIRDITERIHKDESLSNQLAFRQILIDSIPYAIFIKDENGRFVGFNRAYERDFGVDRNDLIGKSVLDLDYIPADERKRFHDEDMAVINEASRRSYELPIAYSDGLIHSTLYSVDGFKYNSGKSGGLIGLLVDITERKKAEEALQNISRVQSLILDNSFIGIALIVNYKFEWANNILCDLFNLTEEGIKNADLHFFFNGKEAYEEYAKNDLPKLRLGSGCDSIIQLRRTDGSLFMCRLIGKAINPNSPLDGSIWMFEDISERISREAKIQEYISELKELNATKDKFFSIIAHDLRNPLGSFKMATNTLYESYDSLSDERKLEFLKLITQSASNVYSLLENLLEWSASQRGTIKFKKEIVDLCTIVESAALTVKNSADNKKIAIYNYITEQTNVSVDVNMINTVIRNLLSNAIKFTGSGKSIFIERDIIGEFLEISVRDEGVGMTPETIAKLFRIDDNVTELGTMKEKGTGLGLILCKEFVEKHGGTISAHSEIGKGSKFIFTLPYA